MSTSPNSGSIAGSYRVRCVWWNDVGMFFCTDFMCLHKPLTVLGYMWTCELVRTQGKRLFRACVFQTSYTQQTTPINTYTYCKRNFGLQILPQCKWTGMETTAHRNSETTKQPKIGMVVHVRMFDMNHHSDDGSCSTFWHEPTKLVVHVRKFDMNHHPSGGSCQTF